ncbi:MAG: competence/damage-inducible protein A [Methylococcaceae bacterium]|nr:competence/damage-inducible protein A [Methylococcaceae bacterium]
MNPILEILSQGEEIVTGQVVDTNAAWLSQEAVDMGFRVARHISVGDKLDDLIAVMSDIAARADCCICTGGLGPTSDDLTAEAVSKAFNRSLVFDETAYEQIRRFFEKRQRRMPESNRKQALLPVEAIRLDNHWGTAPGFALKHEHCWFWFVPGVPYEMRQLFKAHVKPMMQNQFDLQPGKLIILNTVGIGESDLQDRINAINLPPEVQLGFRAEIGQVQIKLLFPSTIPQSQMEEITDLITTTLGDFVYSIDGLDNRSSGDLVAVVDRLMKTTGKTIAIVETASHGMLTAKIRTANWLTSTFIYPSITSIAKVYQVENQADDVLETSKAIGAAIQKTTDSDCLLIQLIDENQHSETSVTIVNTLLERGEITQSTHLVSGDDNRKQQMAALLTLDFLRRYLLRANSIR